MTRTITFLLCAVAFSAALGFTGAIGVSSPSRADDDLEVLWDQYYDFGFMNGGFGIYGEYYTQDDFTLETDAELEAVECWAYYYPEEPDYHPQPFNVTVREDHYGMPGGYYFTPRTFDVEETYTGFDYHGHPLYHYRLNIEPRDVDGGMTFWLEIRTDAENCNWGCKTTGNLYYQWNQWNKAAFFRLLGTPDDTRVEAASWGEIKAAYSE